jgi:hypothetical protein
MWLEISTIISNFTAKIKNAMTYRITERKLPKNKYEFIPERLDETTVPKPIWYNPMTWFSKPNDDWYSIASTELRKSNSGYKTFEQALLVITNDLKANKTYSKIVVSDNKTIISTTIYEINTDDL